MDAAHRALILEQLTAVLASETFRSSERSRALLKFLVERVLAGEAERLKEYTLGVEALGRGEQFDPRTDAIVRAEASRLRRKLEQYYAGEGRAAALRIVLPRGGYAPQFEPAAQPNALATRAAAGRAWYFSLGIAVGATALGAAFIGLRPTTAPAPQRLLELDVDLRARGIVGSDVGTDVVISPDGSRIAFVARGEDGRARLNVRALDDATVIELPGTDGARAPFFSPDGQWLGFLADGAIKKVAVAGGPPIAIAESRDLLGADWSAGGDIFAATRFGVLARISAAGGEPSTVLDLSDESATAVWPQVLPGGDRVLITVSRPTDFNGPTLEVLSLVNGKRTVVLQGGTFGRYVEDGAQGYLLYINQGALFALPFDVAALAATGAAFPVLDDVAYSPNFGYAQLDVSSTGTLVYRRDAGSASTVLASIDRAGHRGPLPLEPGRYLGPRLSPDGRSLVVGAVESGARAVLLHEPAQSRTTRLRVGSYSAPTWLPDGRGLILGGATGLAWLPLAGDAEPQPLTATPGPAVPWSFTPDARRVAYHTTAAATHFDLWTLPLDFANGRVTAGTPEPFLQTAAVETWPAFSPDGRWLAYGSNESGAFEVYVRAFPDDGSVTRVSLGGGRMASWARDGRELLYRTDDGRVMVVGYAVESGAFVASKPEPWTPLVLADTGVAPSFDLAADGEHIVGLVPAEPNAAPRPNQVTFIFDLFGKLRR